VTWWSRSDCPSLSGPPRIKLRGANTGVAASALIGSLAGTGRVSRLGVNVIGQVIADVVVDGDEGSLIVDSTA
jgi:hypothetical protein